MLKSVIKYKINKANNMATETSSQTTNYKAINKRLKETSTVVHKPKHINKDLWKFTSKHPYSYNHKLQESRGLIILTNILTVKYLEISMHLESRYLKQISNLNL